MNRRIDVVVVTYESAPHLPACLGALPASVQVIVVDNASADDSAAIAERVGAEVIRNTTNRGFAAAANQGVRAGHAELVLLLNPDASIDEVNLARLVDAIGPEASIVGPCLVMEDGTEQRPFWPFPSPRSQWRGAMAPNPVERRDGPGFVVGACLLTTRALWNELGGLDEAFWLYGEEADFCKRAYDRGYGVSLVESAVAHHVGGASGKALGALTFEHFVRGSERFVFKHHGAAGLVSYRAASVVRHGLRSFVRRGVNGEVDRANLKRSLHALVHFPALVHEPDVVRGRELVVASLEPWDDVWRRNQFLVRELTAADPSLRVLWVDPAFDALHAFRSGAKRTRPFGRLVPLDGNPNVSLFQPTKFLPRRLWPRTDAGLARQVRRAVDQLGFVGPTLWINDPAMTPLTGTTVWPVLYDITDDWLDAKGTDRQLSRLREYETTLLRRANCVVVCSPALAERRGQVRPVDLIPNAVDVAHFRRPRERPDDLPAGKRTAVYVGTLHPERVDIELVVGMAKHLPDVAFVFVGPDALRAEDRDGFAGLSNVVLLGPRPYADVPAYLQHADVIIVPHVVSSFTESLDPIKAYEILAVGRSCVATPVAGFRDLADPVVVADRSEFAAAVEAVLIGPSRPVETDVPSWTDRAAMFSAALDAASMAASPAVGPATFRVVFLDHCAKKSGGELALLRLLSGFAAVTPTVLLAEDGEFVDLLHDDGIDVEVLLLESGTADLRRDAVVPGRLPVTAVLGTLRYVRVLRRRLRELDPDIIHTNSLKALVYGSMASVGLRGKLVWHVRDRIADDYLPHVVAVAIRTAARRVPDAIIANSSSTLQTLGRGGRSRHGAPSLVVFDAIPRAFRPRRHPSHPFTVGMVGRLAPWKGQDVFLRAFAAACTAGTECAVIAGSAMFGESAYEGELLALVAELGIADRVVFRGFVEDVPTLLSSFDVLVHASVIPEPFGQVVVEGMAAGLAVVAANAGGPAEVVTNGVDGVLVEPGDVDALAQVLRDLAADPARRKQLGVSGRATAAAFTPERVAAKVEGLYARLVAPTGPPRPSATTRMQR